MPASSGSSAGSVASGGKSGKSSASSKKSKKDSKASVTKKGSKADPKKSKSKSKESKGGSRGSVASGEEQSAKNAKGPTRTKVTQAPKIYSSAYSDIIWTMLKDYTKEVLRTSPTDVLAWSAEYYAKKVNERRTQSEAYRSKVCGKGSRGGPSPGASASETGPSRASSSRGGASRSSAG